MEIFLSHSFRPEDATLVSATERLLSSHDIRLVHGRRNAGGELTQEIMSTIARSDALVAMMTRRERIGRQEDGRWRTHPWVRDELNHGRGLNLHAIALVEEGVEIEGAYASHEFIRFERNAPLEAFLALSDTLRQWKEAKGRIRTAFLLPDAVGSELRRDPNLICRYRFVEMGGRVGEWREGRPLPGEGGTMLFLDGVRDESAHVEIQIVDGTRARWWSAVTPQTIRIEMREQ